MMGSTDTAFLAVTRFNNKTWRENVEYRRKHDYPGCVYGSPRLIANHVAPDAPLIVLEMNLSTKRIEGVGLIRNRVSKKRAKVYSDSYYNLYTYNTRYRIDRSDFTRREDTLISIIEQVTFGTRRHCMRGHGITRLPLYIQEHKELAPGRTLLASFRERFPEAPLEGVGWPDLIPDHPELLAARARARAKNAGDPDEERDQDSIVP